MDSLQRQQEGVARKLLAKKRKDYQAWSPYLGRLRGDHTDDLTGADQKIPVKITFQEKVKTAISHET